MYGSFSAVKASKAISMKTKAIKAYAAFLEKWRTDYSEPKKTGIRKTPEQQRLRGNAGGFLCVNKAVCTLFGALSCLHRIPDFPVISENDCIKSKNVVS